MNQIELITVCQYCKKPLPGRKPWRKSKTGYVFCNTSCAAKHNNQYCKRREPEGKCVVCEKPIKSTLTYCKICFLKYMTEKMNPVNHSINKLTLSEAKGQYESPSNVYARIRDHARITYKRSDKPKECVLCGYNKHYEVCHIKAVSSFNGTALISEINHIDNLVALCCNCHWEVDHNMTTLG